MYMQIKLYLCIVDEKFSFQPFGPLNFRIYHSA